MLKDIHAADVKLTAELGGHAVGSQSIYVRYDQNTDSFVRVSIEDNSVIVEQKAPGGKVERLLASKLGDKAAERAKQLEVSLSGDQLTVIVDDVQLSLQQISNSIVGGNIALASKASLNNEKDDIYDAVFDNIKVTTVNEDGTEHESLYKNGYVGIEGLISRVKNAINASFDWAIDTF